MLNEHFIVHDKVCIAVENAVKAISDSKVSHIITRTFHPDELMECGRKIIYRKRANKYQLSSTNSECDNDYSAKSRWINLLKSSNEIKVLDSWTVANSGDCNIVTKIDCIIEIPGLNDFQYVVYIKSIPSANYKDIKNGGATRKDIIRTTVDMWLVEVPNGLIIYENRDNLDFIVYKVLPQDAIINSIRDKTKELYEHQIKSTIPLRPYKVQGASECQECEFIKECWSKE